MIAVFTPVAIATAVGGATARTRCEIENVELNSPAVSDSARAAALVSEATVILRARAGGAPASAGHGHAAPTIGFNVIEIIKADSASRELRRVAFAGQLVDDDDFNGHDVPYATVSRSGLHGSCFAQTYRSGAEYLFLLEYSGAGLTPYWAPLEPTNEQLHGDGDVWLAWVRRQAARGTGRRP